MCMCKQMLAAIFIIAIAFTTKAKFQLWIRKLCTSANSTLVSGYWSTISVLRTWWCSLSTKLCSSMNILWIVSLHIPCHKEENQKVQQRCNNRYCCEEISCNNISNYLVTNNYKIKNRHPLHLHRNDEIQKHLHIWKTGRKSQKYR